MATYKQRTPQATSHNSTTDAIFLSTESSLHHQQHHPSSHSTLHGQEEPPLLDNASDHEWTSIRNTVSARARARQQHRRHFDKEQQQLRAQEWHFILGGTQRSSTNSLFLQPRTLDHTQTRTHPEPTLTATTTQDHLHGHGSASDKTDDVVVAVGTNISSDEDEGGFPKTKGHLLLLTLNDEKEGANLTLNDPTQEHHGYDQSSGSALGFTDLTSDGLESEDLGIWSQDEDDLSSVAPTLRSLPYYTSGPASPSASPSATSSSTTSLSNLAHPSFASQQHHRRHHQQQHQQQHYRFQNQMPFHDGSGNFGQARGLGKGSSEAGSEQESDHGSESSSSMASSTFRPYPAHHQLLSRHSQRWRSSQRTPGGGSRLSLMSSLVDSDSGKSRAGRVETAQADGLSGQQSRVGGSILVRDSERLEEKRKKASSIYAAEMEDVEAMVIEIPSKLGWLEVFEQALNAFNANEIELDTDDSAVLNPIKALVRHATPEEPAMAGLSKTLSPDQVAPEAIPNVTNAKNHSNVSHPPQESTPSTTPKPPSTSSFTGSNTSLRGTNSQMRHLKQKVSASSLEALQLLQQRQRISQQDSSTLAQRRKTYPGQNRGESGSSSGVSGLDPMQVDFKPTVFVDSRTQESDHPWTRATRSKSTMTGERKPRGESSHALRESSDREGRPSTLITTVLSTLRRFRDHVASNMVLYPDQEDEAYLSNLGFEGDMGIEWGTGRGSPPSLLASLEQDQGPGHHSSHGHGRMRNRTVSQSMGVGSGSLSSSSGSSVVRRIGSECGMESMRTRLVVDLFE